MSDSLNFAILLVAILLYLVIFIIFKKGRMPLKFVLVWLIPATIIFLITLIPNVLEFITHFLGFQTTSNMIIGILFVILIFITISLTIIVSGQNTKIILLIQEISILKNKIGDESKDETD